MLIALLFGTSPIVLTTTSTSLLGEVIGTLAVGNDITSNYTDYYYLKALSIEVMNEKGQETVNN